MTQADFLKADFTEAQMVDGDMTGSARFFNRELSWLGFNWRVLEEAENTRVPLLERVRFLSISATNLDEFYTVRVAGLRELAQVGNITPSMDGLTPAEQLILIDQNTRSLLANQQRVFIDLQQEMERENITILTRDDLSDEDRIFLKDV
ncbi:MAG: polyphosphate kinase, partial [Octadecabacter sp.]